MGVVATESWTGTNGSAWPAQWTTIIGTSSIQNNGGQITAVSGAYKAGRVDLTGTATGLRDCDIFVQVFGSVNGVEQYVYVGMSADPGTDSGFGNTNNEVYVQLNYNATDTSSVINMWQGQTKIVADVSKTLTGTTTYSVRFRRYAGVLYARVWPAASAEPTSWDMMFTMLFLPNNTNPTGSVSLAGENGGATTQRVFTFDNFSVDDLGTSIGWLRI